MCGWYIRCQIVGITGQSLPDQTLGAAKRPLGNFSRPNLDRREVSEIIHGQRVHVDHGF